MKGYSGVNSFYTTRMFLFSNYRKLDVGEDTGDYSSKGLTNEENLVLGVTKNSPLGKPGKEKVKGRSRKRYRDDGINARDKIPTICLGMWPEKNQYFGIGNIFETLMICIAVTCK